MPDGFDDHPLANGCATKIFGPLAEWLYRITEKLEETLVHPETEFDQ